jgi:glycolate oxidase FAD binding subunit
MTGSFGVLAALTSVTLKVLPAPPREITLLLMGLNDANAMDLLADVLTVPADVSAAAHLGGCRSDAPVTALRLEGFQDPVGARATELESRLHKLSDIRRIEAEESGDFWRKLRDLSSFAADLDPCVWRCLRGDLPLGGSVLQTDWSWARARRGNVSQTPFAAGDKAHSDGANS